MSIRLYDGSSVTYIDAGLGYIQFPHRFDTPPEVWVGDRELVVCHVDVEGFMFKSARIDTGYVRLDWVARLPTGGTS